MISAITMTSTVPSFGDPGLPVVDPTDAGCRAETLNVIDTLVAEGIRKEQFPGAVVVVGFNGQLIHRRAYGFRQLEPTKEKMTVDTIFDLASLTKPIATATSVMQLDDRDKIKINGTVGDVIPEFNQNGKADVTIEHLLLHTSGLIPDNSLNDYQNTRADAFDKIHALPLWKPLGEQFAYSDVNFIVLGELVERVSKTPLDEYVQSEIFQPLKMKETGYNPDAALRSRIAPTSERQGKWIRGTVHDPRAHALSGVAGHAGLFSTADDLSRYAQMVLNGGELDGVRVLSTEQVDLMMKPHDVPRGKRTWGWDNQSGYSSNRGDLLSERAIGHGGFTGTSIWIDPDQQLFVIVLTNRLHPRGRSNVNSLIGRIGTVAAAACLP